MNQARCLLFTAFMLVTLGLFAIPSEEMRAEGPVADGRIAEGEAKEEVKWLDYRFANQELSWLVQTAYGPSTQLEDKKSFEAFGQTLVASSKELPKTEDRGPRLHWKTWTISIKGEPDSAWEVPKTGGGHTWPAKEVPKEAKDESKEAKPETNTRPAFSIGIYFDDLGRAYYQPRYAQRASLFAKPYLFLDFNLNGKVNDEMIDGMIFGLHGKFAFPFAERIPLNSGLFRLKVIKKNKQDYLQYRKTPFLTKGSARVLQKTLNQLRMDFGLFPVISDAEWNGHCEAHCKYMRANNVFSHHEDPTKKHFTANGHIAGMNGILAKGNMAAGHALFSLFDTPLHGIDVRSPNFSHAAFGYMKPYSTIRSKGLRHRDFAFGKPWSFPPNGAKGIPVEWPAIEMPDPRIDLKRGKGYPINFYTKWGIQNRSQSEINASKGAATMKSILRTRLKSATASMTMWDGKAWKEVEIQHTYNKDSAPASLAAFYYVHHYVLPQAKLASDTLHRITLSWLNEDRSRGEYEMSFWTGERRAGHIWPSTQSSRTRRRKK